MTDLLQTFVDAGVLDVGDVAVGRRVCQLCRERDERVHLAAALLVRSLRAGSVALDLRTVAEQTFESQETTVDTGELAWPDPAAWLAAVEASPATTLGPDGPGARPLRLVDGLLYLERYWGMEETTRAELIARRSAPLPLIDESLLRAQLDQLFPGTELAPDEPDLQRRAAATAVAGWVSVIAGGPGTGKTTTLARLLALLLGSTGAARPPRVALAAPTGKAAVRMLESLRGQLDDLPGLTADVRAALAAQDAGTLHRLLGWRPGGNRYAHDRANPLPYDVVVVDEMSMVSLLLMTRLLEALRPGARLIMIGDPDQLASVEAGAVLADVTRAGAPPRAELAERLTALDADGLELRGRAADATSAETPVPPAGGWPGQGTERAVTSPLAGPVAERGEPASSFAPAASEGRPLGSPVVELTRNWRFGSGITALAAAIRAGDADATLAELRRGGGEVGFVEGDLRAGTPPELYAAAVGSARRVALAARAGEVDVALSELDTHRLLAGHRSGPYGAAHWGWQLERWLADELPGLASEAWYVGRPVLVTKNLRDLDLVNGDAGIVVPTPDGPQIAFPTGGATRYISPAQVSDLDSLYAMTVHKAQGSQYGTVSLILPPPGSPLLSRELLYTAVTRAQKRIVVYGEAEAVAEAVSRPALRASGLQKRLGSNG